MIGESWMKWAVAEGGTKAASIILQKYLGVSSGTFLGALVATLIIGVIQALGALFGVVVLMRQRVRAGAAEILGGGLFGFIAAAMTILGVYSFSFPGADVGVRTFLVTLSIIPGAIIDRMFFSHPIVVRQWLGIGFFLLSGYAILNFPPLAMLLHLPPWIWITLVIALFAAVNEAITQSMRQTDPFSYNVWVGLATIIFAAAGLFFFAPALTWQQLTQGMIIGSSLVGALVLLMISFKLLAYKAGGSITLKKLIMQSTYLILSVVLGVLIYQEALTAGKVIGIMGFIFAFTLTDQATWLSVSRKIFRLGT